MMGKRVWEILKRKTWSFCKYLPESGILIQGQAALEDIAKKPNQKKWSEQGSWFGKYDKSYACTLVHAYVFEDKRILVYSGPDTATLLHEFTLPTACESFPFKMQHTHLCGQDNYACEWIFLDENTFEMRYTVLGPKKNYRIEALYTGNV
jgi:hypothetical protein